jgi:hypothetical protein
MVPAVPSSCYGYFVERSWDESLLVSLRWKQANTERLALSPVSIRARYDGRVGHLHRRSFVLELDQGHCFTAIVFKQKKVQVHRGTIPDPPSMPV